MPLDKDRFWIVTATRTIQNDDWTVTEQVPTFVLDGWVQGIVNEDHAKRIAERVLIGDDTSGTGPFMQQGLRVSVSVAPME